jgi:hypothetical protein
MALLYGPHVIFICAFRYDFSIMIIPLLDISLNISYMMWSVYVMLAERYVACHCDDSFYDL